MQIVGKLLRFLVVELPTKQPADLSVHYWAAVHSRLASVPTSVMLTPVTLRTPDLTLRWKLFGRWTQREDDKRMSTNE